MSTLRTLFLVRHAKTLLCRQNLLKGSLDVPCYWQDLQEHTPVVAQLLNAEIEEDADYSLWISPLLRALQSAEALVPTLHTLPQQIIKAGDLQERDLGSWSGKTWEQIQQTPDFKEYLQDRQNFDKHGGESYTDVYNRARRFLNTLPSEGLHIVVAHSTINRVLLHILKGVWKASQDHTEIFCIRDDDWRAINPTSFELSERTLS